MDWAGLKGPASLVWLGLWSVAGGGPPVSLCCVRGEQMQPARFDEHVSLRDASVDLMARPGSRLRL